MSRESPITLSHNWFRGQDDIFEYSIVDADGAAVNITSWALEWVMRESESASTAALTKTTAAGITITNGAGGVLQVAISDTDTLTLEPRTYVYALRRTDAGSEQILAFGDAVLRDVAAK